MTGGPGGGKTTFVRNYADRFDRWWTIAIEESATALKAEYTNAETKYRSDSAYFQQQVLHRQLQVEEGAYAAAQACSRPTILLADRGLFDSVGFVPFSTYQELLLRMGLTAVEVVARYDAIVFLKSIVPSGKAKLDRFARPDAGAFAAHVRNVEDILLNHLSAHPNLVVIDPQDTMDEKMRLTRIAVENFVMKAVSL